MRNIILLIFFSIGHFFALSQTLGITDLNVNGETSCTSSCTHFICAAGDSYNFYYPRSTYCPAASSIFYSISYNTSLGIAPSIDDRVNGAQVEVKWNPAYFETGATATLTIHPTFPLSQVPNTTCPGKSFSVTISKPLTPEGTGGDITGPSQVVRRSQAYSYYLEGEFQNISEYHWYLDDVLIGSQRTLSYSFSNVSAGSHILKCIPATKCGVESSLVYTYPIDVSVACEGSIIITGDSEINVGETRRIYLDVANSADYTWGNFPIGLENLGPHFQGGINVKFNGTGLWEMEAVSSSSVICGKISKTVTVVRPCISETIFSSEVVTLPAPPNQNLIIPAGCDVTYVSTESVILSKGIIVQDGGLLTIKIDHTPLNDPSEDLDKHWGISFLYDENENIVAASKQFYDKMGRVTQGQVKSNSTGHVFASQIIYDGEGNAAIFTLPAPIFNQAFNYKEGFVLNESGQEYNYLDFDRDGNTGASGEVNNPNPVAAGKLGGLGWYYSNKNNLEPFTDVSSFPYSRSWSEKSPDPSITKSSGPSEILRMGTGKEVESRKEKVVNDPILQHYYSLRHYFVTGSSPTNTGEGYKIKTIDTNEKELINYINGKGEGIISAVHNGTGYEYAYVYFNDVGNAVAEIAPKGVNLGSTEKPGFVTNYEYDQHGNVLSIESPDAGLTKYVYSIDGKLRFSQNAEQRATTPKRFSYTLYDEDDRAIESGEYLMSGTGYFEFQDHYTLVESISAKSILKLADKRGSEGALDASRCKEVSKTFYDLPSPEYGALQNFLIGRVSKTSNDNITSWYSYDQFGRLEWMKQSIAGLGIKTIEYTYDFLGNVLEVAYQKGQPDAFHHHYEYDEDQRMKKVYTSRDGINKTIQESISYYLHGPMKRVELGDQLQGIDFTYNINGQLKAINHPDPAKDPGQDGTNGFAPDVFGMTLEYFEGDYNREGTNISSIDLPEAEYEQQYGGNIRAIGWRSKKTDGVKAQYGVAEENPNMYAIKYDAKYQLQEAVWGTPDYSNKTFTSSNALKEFGLTYDAHGNIITLNRTNRNGVTTDQFIYNYDKPNTNQLTSVDNYASYRYNAIGQMIEQTKGGVTAYISYGADGKITGVYKDAARTDPVVTFAYDDGGFRVKKVSYGTVNVTTYYVNDINGNVIAAYDDNGSALEAKEYSIYGGSRLGVYFPKDNITAYEMKDHLGNVRALIASVKKSDGSIDLLSFTDYYPFGSVARSDGRNYRYGYQGDFSEEDEETGLNAFELRMYDAKIGRWLSVDPYGEFWSPYVGMGNDPVSLTDPDGGQTGGANVFLGADNIWTVTAGGGSMHLAARGLSITSAFATGIKENLWNKLKFGGQLISGEGAAWNELGSGFKNMAVLGNPGYSPERMMMMNAINSAASDYINNFLNLSGEEIAYDIGSLTVEIGVGILTSKGAGAIGGASSKIIGTAQATGTRGHALLSNVVAYRYALDPRVSRVTLDLGYKRLLGGGAFKWGPRPDVGVLFKSGRVKVIEFGSKSDDLAWLRSKNVNFMTRPNVNIRGEVSVSKGALYINRIFPKK